MSITVVGCATGSNNIECWHFEQNNDFCKKFCEHLARETGRNVIVLEGEVIGTYSVSKVPIDYTPFHERFKQMADSYLSQETFAGKEFKE